MANVVTVDHPDGSVSYGVNVDGTFIPFGSVSGVRIAHLQDRAKTLTESLASDDPEEVKRAQDAIDQLPISNKKAKDEEEVK